MPDGTNMRADRDMLATLVSWFEDSEQATQDAREKAERDRDYYDGKQLTADEISALEARKQPPIVINRIRRKIDYLQGLEKQARQDPKAYPRTPKDEQAAEAATDALRFIVDRERFSQIASRVWENVLVEGAGAVDVCVEEGGEWGYEIAIKRVPWDRLFFDPHSSEADFSDAKYIGLVMWMDEADVLARWPDGADAIENSYAAQTYSDTYDDRPKYGIWGDSTRKRVRVAQVYWRSGNGGWMYAAYTKGGYLDEEQPSPYVDEDGMPVCPLVCMSGYVDRDNNRYGVVRDMIDPQDEINKRRSKALHLMSVRQVKAELGAVKDVEAARQELAKPDGYVEVAPGMQFDILETQDLANGQAQLLQEAKAEIDGMGPNAAMQGKQGGDPSGRAIALQQQGGVIEVGGLLDAHRDWKRRVYEAIWQRVRQYWTSEVWVRVTDDSNKPRFVGLNVPVTLEQYLTDLPPEEAQQIAAQMGLMPGDPRLAEVVDVKNDTARTMVDIVIDESPDVVTLQSEQQAVIRDVMQAVPALAPMLLEPFIRSTNLRNKDDILERIQQAMNQPPPQPPTDPAKAAAEQARMEQDAQKAAMDAQLKQLEVASRREAEEARIAAEDRRKAAELEMQWQIAQLNASLKAQEAQNAAAMERERMAVENERQARAQDAEMRRATQPMMDLSGELTAALRDMLTPIAARVEEVATMATAPREIVRGPDGRAIGVKVGNVVRQIARGPDGRAMGIE